LGADPELRYTQSQTPVATLSIATTHYKGEGENKEEQTEWHRVVVWGRQAENCNKYLSKGRSVYVEGRLQTRSWDDKSGVTRYTTEIIAQQVQFLGGGERQAGTGHQQQKAPTQAQGQSHADAHKSNGSSAAAGGPPPIEEIPFAPCDFF
jgi:single-strand DNA-binding protein